VPRPCRAPHGRLWDTISALEERAGGGRFVCAVARSGKEGWSCIVLCFEGLCRRTGRIRVTGRVHLMRAGVTRTTQFALRTRSAGDPNSSQSRRHTTP